jgi:uncharacterized hydrophobic protein (TIGR00271 family)
MWRDPDRRVRSVSRVRHRFVPMIALEVFGQTPAMTAVAERLDELDGVSRVRIETAVRDEHSLVLATVSPNATDHILQELRALSVARDDVTLTRVEELGGGITGGSETSLIWADVVGLAGSNARLIARYLAFMAVAGVIACYGVVDTNPILIVGAMAVSPDLLPITATAVGVIGRSLSLTARALLTLTVGMAVATVFAAIFAFAQNHLSLLPSGFNINATVLRSLATVNDETIAVALAAGVAGMLAFETRASSGVGVAISVTTIPAAAYLGVAAGLGQTTKALGALAVLGTNVAMMVLGAATTLALQRLLANRRNPQQQPG